MKLQLVTFLILIGLTNCFSKPIIREVGKDGYIVKLDLSTQVLHLNIPDDKFSGTAKGKAITLSKWR